MSREARPGHTHGATSGVRFRSDARPTVGRAAVSARTVDSAATRVSSARGGYPVDELLDAVGAVGHVGREVEVFESVEGAGVDPCPMWSCARSFVRPSGIAAVQACSFWAICQGRVMHGTGPVSGRPSSRNASERT